MKKLIGLKSGADGSFFEIIDSKKIDNLERYPSINKGGVEINYPLCGTDEQNKEYWDNKQKVTYNGFRLTVVGNPISAEMALQDMGYNASSSNPTTVDIYVDIVHGGSREGAGRPEVSEPRKTRTFKTTDTEWLKIQEKAKLVDMNASEYIRSKALND